MAAMGGFALSASVSRVGLGAIALGAGLLVLHRTRVSRRALPRLELHIDLNETLILSDPAGGDTYTDSLNKIVAKLALVRPADGCVAAADEPDDPTESDAAVLARWVWLDGTPLDPARRAADGAPPPLATSLFDLPAGGRTFYSVPALKARFARRFCIGTGSPGLAYAPLYARADAATRWPAGAAVHASLCDTSEEGVPRQLLLPAVLHALAELARRGRSFQLVLRTFGHDLDRVAAALSAFARGEHPSFPLKELSSGSPSAAAAAGVRLPQARLDASRLFELRFAADGGRVSLARTGADAAVEPPLVDEDAIRRFVARPAASASAATQNRRWSHARWWWWRLWDRGGCEDGEAVNAAVGISDDYAHWSAHGCAPWAGKPLWLVPADARVLPLFMDDNLKSDYADSIVAVRVKRCGAAGSWDGERRCGGREDEASGGGWMARWLARPRFAGGRYQALSGEETCALRGYCLVPFPTLHAVLDREWLIRQIDQCEANVAAARDEAARTGAADWVAVAVRRQVRAAQRAHHAVL
jgi:hypothetical protein